MQESANGARQGSRGAGNRHSRLDQHLDLWSQPAKAHAVARLQRHRALDAIAVHEGAVPASQVVKHEERRVMRRGNDARVMTTDAGVALRVEADSSRRRAAENKLAVRAERDDVYLRRAGAGDVPEDDSHQFAP
jgi:hypothetical protein